MCDDAIVVDEERARDAFHAALLFPFPLASLSSYLVSVGQDGIVFNLVNIGPNYQN